MVLPFKNALSPPYVLRKLSVAVPRWVAALILSLLALLAAPGIGGSSGSASHGSWTCERQRTGSAAAMASYGFDAAGRRVHEEIIREERQPQSLTFTTAVAPLEPGLGTWEATGLLANRRITDRTQTHSSEQRFADRTPISSDERSHFLTAVAGAQQRRAAHSEIATNHGMRKIPTDALRRQAIADDLSGTGVITIRSRRLRLCYPTVKVG